MRSYWLICFGVKLILNIEGCSDVNIEIRFRNRNHLSSEWLLRFKHSGESYHQQSFWMSTETIGDRHFPAISKKILFESLNSWIADDIERVRKRYLSCFDSDISVYRVFITDNTPAFHFAGIYNSVGLYKVGKNSGHCYLFCRSHILLLHKISFRNRHSFKIIMKLTVVYINLKNITYNWRWVLFPKIKNINAFIIWYIASEFSR